MKSPAYTFKDEAGRTLLTNGRRVSFFVGSRPACAFGGERDINASQALWEKQTGTKLVRVPDGEQEYINA